MATNVLDLTADKLNRGNLGVFNRDFLGSVRMLEESGFTPLSRVEQSPLNSTLKQVFSRFVEKTGIGSDAEVLRNEYLERTPSMQRAMDLYSTLQNNFASRSSGEKAAIVDFLNVKIDEYITEKDKNKDDMLTLEESEFADTLFEEADKDGNSRLNSQEIGSNFFENYQALSNVVSYFQRTPGILVDMFG